MERQLLEQHDPVDILEIFADQKKWFPIRYLEAKEIAEQNLCKYTKDAATKDCNSSESAKNSVIYIDFIFNCTLEILFFFYLASIFKCIRDHLVLSQNKIWLCSRFVSD